MAYNISKTGQFAVAEIEEYIYEPDGSIWQHVFHHNNPSVNLFDSTDTFTTGVYKNSDTWFNFNICNKLSSWEIMVMQKATIDSALYKIRWIQSVNPFVATFNDVDSADVIKNTSAGYTTSNWGGIYKKNSSTFFCVNNGNSGNWWGAVGAWATYQDGVPAWFSEVITTGYMDVYVRVDSIALNANIGKLGIATAGGQFYEY